MVLESNILIFTFNNFIILWVWKEAIWLDPHKILLYIFYSKFFCRFHSFSILSKENNHGGKNWGERLTFILIVKGFLDVKSTVINPIQVWVLCPMREISLDWWWHYFWSHVWAWWKGREDLGKSKFLGKSKVNWFI